MRCDRFVCEKGSTKQLEAQASKHFRLPDISYNLLAMHRLHLQSMWKEERDDLKELQTDREHVKKVDAYRIVQKLMYIGAPKVVMLLVLLIAGCGALSLERNTDFVEYYAGKHELSNAADRRGQRIYPYDKKFDAKYMDITSPIGFVLLGSVIEERIGNNYKSLVGTRTSREHTKTNYSNL